MPSSLFLLGVVILIMGSRHFGNGWPGTGGHPWAPPGLVPGGVAAFAWASTLSVSSYWAHPAALSAFPSAELAWMALSPIALAAVVVGAVTAVRRIELSPARCASRPAGRRGLGHHGRLPRRRLRLDRRTGGAAAQPVPRRRHRRRRARGHDAGARGGAPGRQAGPAGPADADLAANRGPGAGS